MTLYIQGGGDRKNNTQPTQEKSTVKLELNIAGGGGMSKMGKAEMLLDRLESTEVYARDEDGGEEEELREIKESRQGMWLGDDMTHRENTTGVRIMAYNRQRKALNDSDSIKKAVLHMQAMHTDIGVFHECGEIEKAGTIDRIKNAARDEGCEAIAAGTPDSTAAGTVILIRGAWKVCMEQSETKIFTELGSGGSRLIQVIFKGKGNGTGHQWMALYAVYGYNGAHSNNKAAAGFLLGALRKAIEHSETNTT